MFGWFKRKQLLEQQKLFYQNGAAASGEIRAHFERNGDLKMVARLEHFETENRRIIHVVVAGGTPSGADLKTLLDMNRELRRLFDEVEKFGPEARVRAFMGQPQMFRDFDSKYQPLLGWDSYHQSWQ